jgi:hypothetical protein
MELEQRTERAVSDHVGLGVRLLVVLEKVGFRVAGLLTEAATLLAAQCDSEFPFRPGQVASSTAPAPRRQVPRTIEAHA